MGSWNTQTQTMMSDLMISVSGVRGIVGRSLTPSLLSRLGEAFGTYLNSGTVVVGRDTRISGDMVKHSVFGGLLSSGCRILDVGVVSTPTATMMIEHLKADGGIVISASHNPIEWNALKFFRSDGIYLNAEEGRDLLNTYYNGDFIRCPWDKLRGVEQVPDAESHHVGHVLAVLDVQAIRSRRFRVALDCCNGAGVGVAMLLLKELGCEPLPIHCKPDGLFPHTPEPTFVNLQDLCRHTRETGADVGFATDPDADRLAIVSEGGCFLGEELTLALATRYVLSRDKKRPASVIINMSTSRATEDVAREAGADVMRVPVGEVHVAEAMKEAGAVIGGEGNGGVIYPPVHYGRDAIVGMGLILEMMARYGKPISEIAGEIPRYHMIKTKLECPTAIGRRAVRELARDTAGAASLDTSDGLRIDFPDRWIHLRASNTEPVLRIIGEAKTEEDAGNLIEEYSAKIRKMLP